MKKRIFSSILVAAMMVSLFPAQVFAAKADEMLLNGNSESAVHSFDAEQFAQFEQAIIDLNSSDDSEAESSYNSETNRFALKRLIVQGNIKTDFGASKVISYNDVHILSFDTEEETENAYEQLNKISSVNVSVDKVCEATGYADNSYDYSSGYTDWAAEAMDIGGYRQYLTDHNVDKEVVVAVLDSGINTSHEMFKDRLLKDENGKIVGYSYYDSNYKYSYDNLAIEEGSFSFEDDSGHGSHVAGSIVNLTPSNVKILPVKISDSLTMTTESIQLLAFLRVLNVYSEKYNVVCVNMSYVDGGKDSQSQCDMFNSVAYERLRAKNILPVISSGNDADRIDYDIKAVVVAALQKTENSVEIAATYSNYGKCVSVAAPGSDIRSAFIGNTDGVHTDVYHVDFGTSMATPQVAGIVALLYLDPALGSDHTAADVERRLYSNCLDLGVSGKDDWYGYGLVNLKYFEIPKPEHTLTFYKGGEKLEDHFIGSSFVNSFNLSIKCSDTDYSIIYTTDHTIPSVGNAKTYTEAINVSADLNIHAMGVKIVNGTVVERTDLYHISFVKNLDNCFEIDENGQITKFLGKNLTEVIVPDKVKGIAVQSIGEDVFAFTDVQKVILPESCTMLDNWAFFSCVYLKYLYAPGVTSVGENSLSHCPMTFISSDAPSGGATEGYYFPKLQSANERAFKGCGLLRSVKLDELTTLGEYTFESCKELSEVELPELISIPKGAFSDCVSMRGAFTIQKNVTSIGDLAFAGTNIDSFLVAQGNAAFYADELGLYSSNALLFFFNGRTTSYKILSQVEINGITTSITNINASVMSGVELDELTIPSTITNISEKAFSNSKIGTVYYNAISASAYEIAMVSLSFSGASIEHFIIGDEVETVPGALLNNSHTKNIHINSKNTAFGKNSCFTQSNNAAVYIEFAGADPDWCEKFYNSGCLFDANTKTIFSVQPFTLPTTYPYSNLKNVGTVAGYTYYTSKSNAAAIAASAGEGGSISDAGYTVVSASESLTYKITPDDGYAIKDVKVNGVSVGALSEYTFSSVSGSQTISAEFKAVSNRLSISVTNNAGGTVTPHGTQFVDSGGSKTFTFTPDTGYDVDDVIVDGETIGSRTSYTFDNVTENHTLEVVFKKPDPPLDDEKIDKITYRVYLFDYDGVNKIPVGGQTIAFYDADGKEVYRKWDTLGYFDATLPYGTYTVKIEMINDCYEIEDSYTIKPSDGVYPFDTEDKYPTLSIVCDRNLRKGTPPAGFKYDSYDTLYDFSATGHTYNGSSVVSASFTLSELLKTKQVVILNFFKTNCGYCQNELPDFKSFYQKYGDDVAVIMVANDSAAGTAYSFCNSYSLPFYLVDDSKVDLIAKFGITGYPQSLIIDQRGMVRNILDVVTEKKLTDVVPQYFTETPTPTPAVLSTLKVSGSVSMIEGMPLDLSDLVVTAVYSNGTNAVVTDYTVTGFNANQTGTPTVTISYGGKTASMQVTVKPKSVTGIAIQSPPTKVSYTEGESLDTSGLRVAVSYNNGSTEPLNSGFTVSGYDANTVGAQSVLVTYQGFTTSFPVTVVGKSSGKDIAKPVIRVESVEGGKNVILSASEGSTIYYTTDGSQPTSDSAKYTAPFKVTRASTPIKAIAISGSDRSAVTSGTIKVSQVGGIDPNPGGSTVPAGTIVTLRTATVGADIYYTNAPDAAFSKTAWDKYNGGIVIGKTQTIRAVAVKDGYVNSEVTQLKYTVPEPPKDNVVISLGSVTVAAGDVASVPLYLFTDSKETSINGFRISLSFDRKSFENFVSITPADGIESTQLFTSSTGGVVNLLYQGDAITGGGEICTLNFTTLASMPKGTTLDVEVNLGNSSITTDTAGGSSLTSANAVITLLEARPLLAQGAISYTNTTTGQTIETINNIPNAGEIEANVTIDSDSISTMRETTANVYLAVYDRGGRMASVDTWKVDLSDPAFMFIRTIKIPDGTDVGAIKIMVLSDQMVPIIAAGELAQ